MNKIKSPLNYDLEPAELAGIIDYTLLKHEATKADIKRLCEESKNYNFAAVCIRPYYLQLAKEELKDSKVRLCTVISFDDEGTSIVKPEETMKAIEYGADEIDVVMNYRLLKSKDHGAIVNDLGTVVRMAKARKKLVKVILETAALSTNEIICACSIVKTSGGDYVKTSTGKIGGATAEVVGFLRHLVGGKFGVKASGGIKTLENALQVMAAGAPEKGMLGFFRIGTSSAVSIMEEYAKYVQEPLK